MLYLVRFVMFFIIILFIVFITNYRAMSTRKEWISIDAVSENFVYLEDTMDTISVREGSFFGPRIIQLREYNAFQRISVSLHIASLCIYTEGMYAAEVYYDTMLISKDVALSRRRDRK